MFDVIIINIFVSMFCLRLYEIYTHFNTKPLLFLVNMWMNMFFYHFSSENALIFNVNRVYLND